MDFATDEPPQYLTPEQRMACLERALHIVRVCADRQITLEQYAELFDDDHTVERPCPIRIVQLPLPEGEEVPRLDSSDAIAFLLDIQEQWHLLVFSNETHPLRENPFVTFTQYHEICHLLCNHIRERYFLFDQGVQEEEASYLAFAFAVMAAHALGPQLAPLQPQHLQSVGELFLDDFRDASAVQAEINRITGWYQLNNA